MGRGRKPLGDRAMSAAERQRRRRARLRPSTSPRDDGATSFAARVEAEVEARMRALEEGLLKARRLDVDLLRKLKGLLEEALGLVVGELERKRKARALAGGE